MLRRMPGVRRAAAGSWAERIKRATVKARGLAAESGVRDWADLHHERKWSWAGHVARRPCSAITYRVTSWRDAAWSALASENGLRIPLRPSRRRWMKFEAALQKYCTVAGLGRWVDLAEERQAWAEEAENFSRWALRHNDDDDDEPFE